MEGDKVVNTNFLFEGVPWQKRTDFCFRTTHAYLPRRYAKTFINIEELDKGIINDGMYWGEVIVNQWIDERCSAIQYNRLPTSKTEEVPHEKIIEYSGR